MGRTSLVAALLATILASALGVTAAQAAPPPRVFVGATLGSDSNPCTFAQPCRTFQHAHDTVAAGGEIDVLDPAGYGALTITKSISIQGHGFAGLAVPSGNGITINTAGVVVNLRGLLLDGVGGGVLGIDFTGGASLSIQDCLIRNFVGHGINVAPNSGTSKLSVSSTLVSVNVANGITVMPSSSASVIGVLDHVETANNGGGGLVVSGNVTSGTIQITASEVVAANNGGVGISSASGSPSNGVTTVMVRNCTVANNGGTGLVASGNPATLRFTRSTITNNSTGVGFTASAQLISLGDNVLEGNTTNGTPPFTVGYH